MRKLFALLKLCLLTLLVVSCHPVPGPDKSLAGSVLGAGWGAGAGAVIGNQTGSLGPGTGVGAAFGAGAGLLTGIGLDVAEGTQLEEQRQLDALKVQVAANTRSLMMLQNSLDDRDRRLERSGYTGQIFFDEDSASLRAGSAVELERLAEVIKSNPYVGLVEVHGHSDDTGDGERNNRLSEARARTVGTFLSSHGIPMDRMRLIAHGARQPLATNETGVGRQLNRRVEVIMVK